MSVSVAIPVRSRSCSGSCSGSLVVWYGMVTEEEEVQCDVVPLSTPKKDRFQKPGTDRNKTGARAGAAGWEVGGGRSGGASGHPVGMLIPGLEPPTGLLVTCTLAAAEWGFLGSQREISCTLNVHGRAVDFGWP